MVGVAGVALGATVVAACSSTAAPVTPKKAPVTQTVAKQYLDDSGTGDRILPFVQLPKAYTVTWTFNCQDPAKTGTFLLTSTVKGGPAVDVTKQTGLGGGGHKPFYKAGNYNLAVTTTCGWKAVIANTPVTPVKSAVTTTTLAPKSKSKPTTTTKPSTAVKPVVVPTTVKAAKAATTTTVKATTTPATAAKL